MNDSRPEGRWEAIGGIEFSFPIESFPIEEHGGIWDKNWNYEIIDNADNSKTIKLSQTVQNCDKQELNGLKIEVKVTVFPNRQDFELKSTIINP